MNRQHQFIKEILVIAPRLVPLHDQHIKDNQQLLPPAFIKDVARFIVENTRGKGNIDSDIMEIIHLFENHLEVEKGLKGRDDIHKLIGDSFIENLLNEKEIMGAVLHLMGDNLRSLANDMALSLGKQKSLDILCADSRLIERIQDWYSLMCNDEWEHISRGIEIRNIDNPGWRLEVDLMYTPLYGLSAEKTDFNLYHETDWAFYSVENGKFIAAGGPKMLATLLTLFLNWAEENTPQL